VTLSKIKSLIWVGILLFSSYIIAVIETIVVRKGIGSNLERIILDMPLFLP